MRDVAVGTLSGEAELSASRRVGQTVTAELPLSRALAVNERRSFRVSCAAAALRGELQLLEPPTVLLRAAAFAPGQRTTGQESQTRIDSATDAGSRALYGELGATRQA